MSEWEKVQPPMERPGDQRELVVPGRHDDHYQDDTISLLDLLAVLAKRKWLIIGTTFAAALGILIFAIISLILPPAASPLPNQYKANASILINDEGRTDFSSVLSDTGLSGLAGLTGIPRGGTSYGELALRLLESRTILDKVVDDFNIIELFEITEHPKAASRDLLKEKSTFEYEPETGILSISVEDTDPEFARDVANRFVQLLNQRFAALGVNKTETQVEMLEQKIADVESEIGVLETQIENFQRQYGTFSVETMVQEQVTMQARIRSDLILKEMELSTYQDFARIDDPVVQRLRAERDNLRQLLNEMETGYSEYAGVMPSQQELPDLATRFARLQRDLQVQSQIYKTLVQQYELARLSLEGDDRVFQVLELAEVPDRKSGPSRGMICIITTITAFFLAVFLAFVLEYFEKVRQDPLESEKLEQIREHLWPFGRRHRRANLR